MEQKKKYKSNAFLPQNLFYNPELNFIVCPMGQHLDFVHKTKKTSDAGYESEVSVYRAKNCQGCPLREQCHKAQGNRSIELNHKLLRYRKKERKGAVDERRRINAPQQEAGGTGSCLRAIKEQQSVQQVQNERHEEGGSRVWSARYGS